MKELMKGLKSYNESPVTKEIILGIKSRGTEKSIQQKTLFFFPAVKKIICFLSMI